MIVLMDEPAHVACSLAVRIIGVIRLVQTHEGKKSDNDRLIGVAVESFEYQGMKSVEDLNQNFLQQITDFMGLYNKNSDKRDELMGVEGPEEAVALLERAIVKFEKNWLSYMASFQPFRMSHQFAG